ncbi:MAG: tetratricopeptide repeat protein [Candidatus Omnitrophota bacterium]
MKKIIVALTVILIAVYATLAFLGSGGEYASEKLLYKIMKGASAISLNPDAAPPAQLAAVERDLKTLISKYPGTRSAKIAHIALMEFYVANKKYSEAAAFAATIEKTYAADAELLSTAQFLLGTAYEKQGSWSKALAEFKILEEKYPHTQLGMQIPIYIGKYYEAKGKDAEARSAYKEAVNFYSNMEKEYSNKVLGYTASVLLIQSYLNMNDYEAAGNMVDKTLHKYASRLSFMQLLPYVENIYIKKLNQPEKAIELYKYVMDKIKDPRMIKLLNKKIEEIKAKK